MKLYIEITAFDASQAHGLIGIMQSDGTEIAIPISMPIESYQQALENNVLTQELPQPDMAIAQSTIFLSPLEIGRK